MGCASSKPLVQVTDGAAAHDRRDLHALTPSPLRTALDLSHTRPRNDVGRAGAGEGRRGRKHEASHVCARFPAPPPDAAVADGMPSLGTPQVQPRAHAHPVHGLAGAPIRAAGRRSRPGMAARSRQRLSPQTSLLSWRGATKTVGAPAPGGCRGFIRWLGERKGGRRCMGVTLAGQRARA